MAQGAGPLVVAAVEWLVLPAVFVSGDMIVAADRGEIVGGGGPALAVGDGMVEITFLDRRSASIEAKMAAK